MPTTRGGLKMIDVTYRCGECGAESVFSGETEMDAYWARVTAGWFRCRCKECSEKYEANCLRIERLGTVGPELLEACIEGVAFANDVGDLNDDERRMVDKWSAAIAKARGASDAP